MSPGRRTARPLASCSSSAPTASSFARSARPVRVSFAHTVRIDKDDNIWAVDKGSDMVVKFNPDGRVR